MFPISFYSHVDQRCMEGGGKGQWNVGFFYVAGNKGRRDNFHFLPAIILSTFFMETPHDVSALVIFMIMVINGGETFSVIKHIDRPYGLATPTIKRTRYVFRFHFYFSSEPPEATPMPLCFLLRSRNL